MNRLLLSLSTAAAVLAVTAAALFLSPLGVAGVIGGVIAAIGAVILLLAVLGLARDPGARAAVTEKLNARAGVTASALPPASAPVVAPAVAVEESPSEGYTVSGNRAQRRAAARKR